MRPTRVALQLYWECVDKLYMELSHLKISATLRDQRGFTMPELLTTIAILGILLAIAMILWLGLLESRRVTAAANQIAADMRFAHSSATNQLTDWRIVLAPERSGENPDGPDYYLVKLTQPYSEPDPSDTGTPGTESPRPRTFPANVKIENHKASLNDAMPADPKWVTLPPPKPGTTRTIEFNSNGTMAFKAGPSGSVCVTVDGDPKLRVVALSTTSRVRIEDRSGQTCAPTSPTP